MINALDLDYKQLKRTRRVNGERVIEFTVFPTNENKPYFDLLVEEAIVTFDSDEYVIKKVTEKSIGNTYFKQVTAIHKFYVDLINKQQYDVHNGSITFQNYMNFVFEDTPYANFETIDNFSAREFENLGDDNRLALLQKGLDRFKAELELVGSNYKPRFRKMIGRDTDFQFRFGHNIKAISRDIDTTNLATHIRGYGDEELGIYAEYTSPNASIFGVIDAPTVRDERFKSNSAMLDEIKSRLIDEPEISITVDFVDLRRAGYPYTVPDEGDRIWLIYEPMDDLLIETRILEIVEVFDCNENVVRTEVTLSNHKKTFADTVFDNVKKQLSEIVDDDGIIKYSALDEAVKIATEALHSAQTELEFNNGIIAREKTDPNRLVVLNSAGLGISKDGGNTFQEAITADGFVLTAGAIGRLDANHIQIGPETEFDQGYDPSSKETPQGAQNKADSAEQNAKDYAKNYTDDIDDDLRQDLRLTAPLPTSITMNNNGIRASAQGTNRYAQLGYRGLFVKGGAIQIERPDGAVWMEDGMVQQDYSVSTYDPHFMTMGLIEGGRNIPADRFEAFFVFSGYYQQDLGNLDGRGTPSIPTEDVRDPDYGYTVRFQRYEFLHAARYLKIAYRIANNSQVSRHRLRLYEAGTPPTGYDSIYYHATYEKGNTGLKNIVIDLGVPSYQVRRVDLRLGWDLSWGSPTEILRFRIERIVQSDYL